MPLMALWLCLQSTGCQRLNPSWCEEKATCGPDEYCDPGTNTCRAREAGIAADLGLDLPIDSSRDIPPPGDQKPPDKTLPDKNPPPDLKPPPDVKPPPDLTPTG
jgi:hypothetical protein